MLFFCHVIILIYNKVFFAIDLSMRYLGGIVVSGCVSVWVSMSFNDLTVTLECYESRELFIFTELFIGHPAAIKQDY